MDFTWTPEQAALRRAMAELGPRELNTGYSEREARREFHVAGWRACAAAGVHGLPVPLPLGGGGHDPLTAVGALERLGYGCLDNGLQLSIHAHLWTVVAPLLAFGTEDQQRRYVPALATGTLVGASAMTEPGSGSDAFALTTRAMRKGDRYVLSGTKTFVTNGPIADLVVVYATFDRARGADGISAFIVERGFPGVHAGGPIATMGLCTSPLGELVLDGCEVPLENLLGREGGGPAVFTHAMSCERGAILAGAVGAMERLLEQSIAYARSRRQFGQAIGKFQLVATKIADMKLRLETSRGLLYACAAQRASGKSTVLESALVKLHASESWVRSAEDALAIHGGAGYTTEHGIERELRDALGSRIYSGTSEIQRQLVASMLGL